MAFYKFNDKENNCRHLNHIVGMKIANNTVMEIMFSLPPDGVLEKTFFQYEEPNDLKKDFDTVNRHISKMYESDEKAPVGFTSAQGEEREEHDPDYEEYEE